MVMARISVGCALMVLALPFIVRPESRDSADTFWSAWLGILALTAVSSLAGFATLLAPRARGRRVGITVLSLTSAVVVAACVVVLYHVVPGLAAMR